MARKDLINCFTKLEKIVGLGKRHNDVLFSVSGNLSSTKKRHVVFFPGDIQNFHKKMLGHPGNANWSRWSYEDTSTLLHRRFKDSYVWLIKPSRIQESTFSCYDNFLPCDMFGSPADLTVDFGGLVHLRNLLINVIDRVNQKKKSVVLVPPVSTDIPLIVVAFSKGCVVLNQFVRELITAQTNNDLMDFFKQTSALYWLDGGHNLESGVWITDEALLQALADVNVKVRVHVTPRQVNDPGRPHIGQEERIFVDVLRSKGADVSETLHFPDEERSLEQHFRILQEF